jgi:hypothetical protein
LFEKIGKGVPSDITDFAGQEFGFVVGFFYDACASTVVFLDNGLA